MTKPIKKTVNRSKKKSIDNKIKPKARAHQHRNMNLSKKRKSISNKKIEQKKSIQKQKTKKHALLKKLNKKRAHTKKIVLKSPKLVIPITPPIIKKAKLSKEIQTLLSQAHIRHWFIEAGGENCLEIIKYLPMLQNDEELAKKLKIKVSDIRASLNKLHNFGFVTYMRDKNNETGWYSYIWMLNEEMIKRWVIERIKEQELRRPQEGTDFYFCKECGVESMMKFENASECLFKCPMCNFRLDFLDKEKFEQLKKLNEPEKQK